MEQSFELAKKTEELYFSIFDITTNRDYYPVRHQRLSARLQDYALDIHSDILDANAYRGDTPAQKARRFEFQTKAITDCKALGEALSDDGYTEVNDGVLRRDR